MSTSSYTDTYTVVDVRRVLARCAADLAMYADSTGLWTEDYARDVANDASTLAQCGYLATLSVCLLDASGQPIRAAKYEVKTDAGSLTASRPGDAMWPRTSGGELRVVLHYTSAWWALTAEDRQAFQAGLSVRWGPTDIDTTFPGLARTLDRNYVSAAYGLVRATYR